MNQELAAPVKGVTNAFRRGITQTQRIYKSAQNASATYMLDILQPAEALERALTSSEIKIKETYRQSMTVFGPKYAEQLVKDHITSNRLHALTINLLEQLNSLDEYIYDPASFDIGSFPYIQRESERCSDQTIIALGELHQVLLKADLQQFQMVKDDRSSLPSAQRESPTRNRTLSDISPMMEKSTLGLGIQLPTERSQSASFISPTQIAVDALTGNANSSPQNDEKGPQVSQTEPQIQTDLPAQSDHYVSVPEPLKLVERKDKATPTKEEQQLIDKEEVNKQIKTIDQFLQRRIMSRESFRHELNRLSQISTTISPISPHPSIAASPGFQPTPTFTDSPLTDSRPNSYLMTTIMKTLDGKGPPVPPKDDPWTSSSPIEEEDHGKMLADEPDEARKDSETLGFVRPIILPDKLPDTPPDSTGRQSGTDEWGVIGLAGTLKLPGFGDGVEEGLEVAGQALVSDPGLIPADESHSHRDFTPATSVQSVDYAMRHDSSFFKYGGFCESAKIALRGVGGTMKDVTKPAGMYKDVIVMRCTSCSFEVDYNDFHRDRRLERSGTIKTAGIDDIEYRTRFLIKSHMKTKLADSPVFGCMFCVEENKTLEEQDATVFFSSAQLLRHLQKHPRRLKEVHGIKIIYGPQPENFVDFDLHFSTLDAKISPTADIKARLASGGTGYAIINHRPGSKGFKAIDPERRQTLHFAIGARIVGITYPACYNGDWCSGYHDSVKALFPSYAVQFDSPSKEDVTMNPKSSLAATARWDHKPKDNITGWLHFSKKDRITHIAYPYQEFWCWSGMNSKGKWGIFPKDYVDGLFDTGNRAEPPLSPGGFASPTRSFASPSISANAGSSSKKFTLSTFSGSSNNSHTSAPEKEPENPSSHGLFAMKRKTTGLASHFVRRSTVKSQASNASSEYSVASNGSGERQVDINRM